MNQQLVALAFAVVMLFFVGIVAIWVLNQLVEALPR
jgi:hypothetical protein